MAILLNLVKKCNVTLGWGCDPSITKSYRGEGAPMIDISDNYWEMFVLLNILREMFSLLHSLVAGT